MYRESSDVSGTQYAYRGGTSSPPAHSPQAGLHRDGQQVRVGSSGSMFAPVCPEGANDIEGKSGNGRAPSAQAHSGALRARSPPQLGSTAMSPERVVVAATVDQRTTSIDRRTGNAPIRRVQQYNPVRTQVGQTPSKQTVQAGNARPKAAPTKTQDNHIESLKDLMGYATSHPASEAPSNGTLTASQVASMRLAPADSDRVSIDDRIKRLENSVEEKLIKATSEAMTACVTLCKASEERSMQKIEALRRDIQQERANASSAGASSLNIEALGTSVLTGESHAGLVDAISSCVIEKVKEDHGIRNASEQYDQLKEAIKELRSMPHQASKSVPDGDCRSPDFDSLHNMMKEMMKISYSLAKELGMERDKRNREFTEASQRLEAMEQVMTIDSAALSQAQAKILSASRVGQAPNLRSLSQGDRRVTRVNGSTQQGSSSVDDGSTLERVMSGLQRLSLDDSKSSSRLSARPSTTSPKTHSRPLRDSSVHSQGSEEGSQDWSSEVRALRMRLENIFQLNDGAQDSLGASSTIGSLPTVQELSVPGGA